ncbi:MAG: hypothetical protein WCK26_02835 [Candidatus Saccharibacteria bacterium]
MDNKQKELEPQIKPFIYTEDEVFEIRQGLSGDASISDTILEKIQGDPLFSDFSVAMFFPVIGERISKNGEKPVVETLRTGTRGNALKVSFEDCAYVIKQIENSNEPVVIAQLAEIGIGPEQHESLSGYITETFVEGTAINQLEAERCTPEFMEEIGVKIGEAIKQIHAKSILINDQLFSDDMGKSHTIIGPNGEVTFIDFGASVDLAEFPAISDEATYLIMRSTFAGAFGLRSAHNDDEALAMVVDFREKVLSEYTADEAIKLYDGQLINEGFGFLNARIPNVDEMAKAYLEARE